MLAPVVRGRKGEFKKELQALRQRGFTKARIDGQFRSLEEDVKLDRRRNHNIDIVVDRLVIKSGIERRLSESLEVALGLANEIVIVNTFEGGDQLFSRKLACVSCGISMPEMTPRAFSFNSPHGACTTCQGLGATYDFEPRLVVPDETKSLLEGAIAPWAKGDRRLVKDAILALAKTSGLDPTGPFAKLSKKHRDLVLFGIGAAKKAARRRPPRRSPPTPTTTKRRTTNSKCRAAPARFVGRRCLWSHLRGRDPQPAAALRGRVVGGPGGPRAVPDAARVPDLPRAASQAAEPGGGPAAPRSGQRGTPCSVNGQIARCRPPTAGW